MKRKEYESPRTLIAEVELENGFMVVSVYEKEENTEDLTINSQEKGADFDFSGDDEKFGWQ